MEFVDFYSVGKRTFDVTLSLIGLFFFVPMFLFFYPLFVVVIGRPVIFKQKRMGKNKKPFTIYKIRTMKRGASLQQDRLKELNIAPYPMFKIKSDPRFHIFGKILSKFGVDELPQLLNILKGEMSIVGPRPLPVNEAKLLDSSWDFRYGVRPGILSKWALSAKRYESLEVWKGLEKMGGGGTNNWFIISDLRLISEAINKIIIKQL